MSSVYGYNMLIFNHCDVIGQRI